MRGVPLSALRLCFKPTRKFGPAASLIFASLPFVGFFFFSFLNSLLAHSFPLIIVSSPALKCVCYPQALTLGRL